VNGFFATTRHVERDATLSLSILQERIHFFQAKHLSMSAQQRILGGHVGKLVGCGMQ
jgi:hypothetical protein